MTWSRVLIRKLPEPLALGPSPPLFVLDELLFIGARRWLEDDDGQENAAVFFSFSSGGAGDLMRGGRSMLVPGSPERAAARPAAWI